MRSFEKTPLCAPPSPARPASLRLLSEAIPSPRRRFLGAVALTLAVLALCTQLESLVDTRTRWRWHIPGRGHEPSRLPTFPNSTVDGMKWFDCPDSPDTKCAFFNVPWDHLDRSNGEIVSLAVRKFPATVAPSHRKGVLFVNPGGPGGSGTEEIARIGRDLSSIVGGYFDLVSWDPRGVNLTWPRLDCFATEALAHNFQREQEAVGLRFEAHPSSNLSNQAPGGKATTGELAWAARVDAFASAADQTCASHGTKSVLEGSSTAQAARDLRLMAKAMGEKDGVNYWGFSYGTVLGATFAAMFPDEVRRFALDGVVNSDDYYNNFWKYGYQAMNQTYRTLDGFFKLCIEAGPERCALARKDSTLANLHARLDALREGLHERPLAIAHPTLGASILTTSAVQHVIFRALYAPSRWGALAQTLAELERGNGTRAWESLNAGWIYRDQEGKERPFGRPLDMIGSGLICSSVMCSETAPGPIANSSLEKFIDFSREMGAMSIAGEAWAMWQAQCRRWSHHARDVFRGPFTAKTKFPILFVSNHADPVTPLSSAEAMARSFPGSSLLVQRDGHGHCSYAQPSACTHAKLQAYFVDGQVPEFGTECSVDEGGVFEASVGVAGVESVGRRLAREMGRRWGNGMSLI